MLNEIFMIFFWTFVPGLELRASLPYAILIAKMHWLLAFTIACLANILIAPVLWFFLNNIIQIFLKNKKINKIYHKFVIRSQNKLRPYIKKYGVLGVAIFIGIPLPGTGVYTAGIGSYFLGMKFKDYMIASVLGVLIAGIIVTTIVVSGTTTLNFLINTSI